MTRRAIVLGALFEALVICWVVRSEVTARVFFSSWYLVLPGILLLLLLSLYNRAVRHHPRAQLSQWELLTIYLMLAAGIVIPGYGFLQLLIPALGTPHYFATPENQFVRLHPYLPRALFPSDTAALKGLFAGYSRVPWGVWLAPVAGWGSLIVGLCALFLCTAVLISRQWIRAEKLTFPLIALPMEMTGERTGFYRRPLMWVGFAIPVVLQTMLAFHHWFPALPAVVLKPRYFSLFSTRPWTAMDPLAFGLVPFITGLLFMAPADVLFSCWFLYLAFRLLRVASVAMGWDALAMGSAANRFPFPTEQTVGGFLMLALIVVWRGRGGLQASFASALQAARGRAGGGGSAEAWAACGWVVSTLFVLAFFVLFGVPWYLAVGLLVVVLLFCVTMARVRAESGPPWVFGPYLDNTVMWVQAIGTANLPERTLVALGGLRWLFFDIRFLTMPAHLEMLKMSEAAAMGRRRVLLAIAVAVVVAVVVGFWSCLTVSYWEGWGTAKVYGYPASVSRWLSSQPVSWLNNPVGPDWFGTIAIGVGGAVTLALTALRARFVWWPLHPIGYALSTTGLPEGCWFQYLVAWVLKVAVLRFGGIGLYRRALPFATGVILGDAAIQAFWSGFGSLLNIPVYQFVS